MRIRPLASLFNSKRLTYQVGGVYFCVDKGKEVVNLTKKGVVTIKNAKALGIGSDTINGCGAKVKISNSDVACMYMHGNDVVELHNCKLPKQVKHKPSFWDEFWD